MRRAATLLMGAKGDIREMKEAPTETALPAVTPF